MIFFARVFIVVTGAIAFAFAINIDDILYLWLAGIGMASVLLVPGYFLGWFTKRASTTGVLAGMIIGGLYVVAMLMDFIPQDALHICIGMALNFVFSIFCRNCDRFVKVT